MIGTNRLFQSALDLVANGLQGQDAGATAVNDLLRHAQFLEVSPVFGISQVTYSA